MTTTTKRERREVTTGQMRLLEELRGQKCQCGRKKVADWTFCTKCRLRLPAALLERLSGPFDTEGLLRYEATYNEALALLAKKHSIKDRKNGDINEGRG